jgi:hypothetical protein
MGEFRLHLAISPLSGRRVIVKALEAGMSRVPDPMR